MFPIVIYFHALQEHLYAYFITPLHVYIIWFLLKNISLLVSNLVISNLPMNYTAKGKKNTFFILLGRKYPLSMQMLWGSKDKIDGKRSPSLHMLCGGTKRAKSV
jgi:hypothetical protein